MSEIKFVGVSKSRTHFTATSISNIPKRTLTHTFNEEVMLTPQEVKAEIARERREKVKERDLLRKSKRQAKRKQCY